MPPRSSSPPGGYQVIVPKTLIPFPNSAYTITIPPHGFYEVILKLGLRDNNTVASIVNVIISPRRSGGNQVGRLAAVGAVDESDMAWPFTLYKIPATSEPTAKLGIGILRFTDQNNALPYKIVDGHNFTPTGNAVRSLVGYIEDTGAMDEFSLDIAGASNFTANSWFQVLGSPGISS